MHHNKNQVETRKSINASPDDPYQNKGRSYERYGKLDNLNYS